MKYSKGPWVLQFDRFNNPEHEDKFGSVVDDEEDYVLAEVCADAPNAEGNARLMVAAPELLEACLKAYETFTGTYTVPATCVAMDMLEAAIAKAEGK